MINLLIISDLVFTNLINSIIPHNITLNYFFSFFSLRGNSIFIWLVLIIVTLLLEERKNPGIQKRDIRFIMTFFLSFLLTAFLVNIVLKNTFQRPRPSLTPEVFPRSSSRTSFRDSSTSGVLPVSCPKNFSFPSGHASTAFAAAVVISTFDKKRRWLYFFVAMLISLSRIYLGCHYFLDVLIGGMVGLFISKVILGSTSTSLRVNSATPESILDKPE